MYTASLRLAHAPPPPVPRIGPRVPTRRDARGERCARRSGLRLRLRLRASRRAPEVRSASASGESEIRVRRSGPLRFNINYAGGHRACNAVFVVYKVLHRTHGNLAVNAPSVTAGTHTAFYSRLDPQHNTHLMFVCIAHPGSRLSERGEPREGVEAVDERLRRRAIVAADGVERIDACDTKRMGSHKASRGVAVYLVRWNPSNGGRT